MKLSYLMIPALTILFIYAISLLLLLMSVAGYTKYWKNKIAEPAAKNALVYVALGDSAAQSIGATSPEQGYVGQFAKRLQKQTGREVRVINLSKSGARIADVIKDQLPELVNYKPDVITLDIGGNDIAIFEADKFKQEFSDLIQRLPAKTIVADVPYFGGRTQLPLFGSGAAEKSVLVANQIIREIMDDKSQTLVPLHEATKTKLGRRVWNYAPDYFHPNNLGYNVWTDAFWQAYQHKAVRDN